jgi:hypothetical protein
MEPIEKEGQVSDSSLGRPQSNKSCFVVQLVKWLQRGGELGMRKESTMVFTEKEGIQRRSSAG